MTSLIPMVTADEFTEGAFGDLVTDYSTRALEDACIEGTRMAEDLTGRRLAPFTGLTETVRVAAIDPDEQASAYSPTGPSVVPSSFDPLPPGTNPLAQCQIRHCWLRQHPPRYQDLWGPYTVTALVVAGPGGFTIPVTASDGTVPGIIDGPDEAGHLWFQPGQLVPTGARVRPTYSGGYSTYPASLVRACKYFVASIIVRELNPDDVSHDPDALYASGEKMLVDGGWVHPEKAATTKGL